MKVAALQKMTGNRGQCGGKARPLAVSIGRSLLAVVPALLFSLTRPASAETVAAPVSLAGHDLSPWGMFAAASVVVQAVMIGLLMAGLVTWVLLATKSSELASARKRARRALATLEESRSLEQAIKGMRGQTGACAGLLNAAMLEIGQSADVATRGGLKERVASHLERLEAAEGRRMSKGTGILASIGSTAPFIGLFGTVWGIMTSFIGIAESQTTNLAVVAPGIAEALLATAIGLVAAIPAVVIYNMFSRSISGYRAIVGDVSAAVMRLVSRDMERVVLAEQQGYTGQTGRVVTLKAAE